MASNNNDFPLFPYPEMWNDQSYQPYPDQSYMNTTSFDSYQTHPAYVQPDQYSFGHDASFQSKSHVQSHDTFHSPTHSTAQSFDVQQPPVLSSTSDSGASAPSTISSAMGSPSMQPQGANNWANQQNMAMLPDIVHPDGLGHDIFASTGFDIETIPVTDKGCVGEFNNISSSQPAQSAFPFNFSPNPSSFDFTAPGSFAQDLSLPQLSTAALPMSSGLSANMPLAITPPNRDSMSPKDSFFKSPTTAASATSPVLERVRGKRKSTVAHNAPKRPRASSPLTQAMSYNEADLPPRPQAPLPTFSSPFFSQSSGYFVPPLESSCPSPAKSPISYSLFPRFQSRQRDQNIG